MAEVFLGYDCRNPRFVALKVPRERFLDDPGAIGRLRREGEIYRNLTHGSIVRLLDEGDLSNGGYFLAQEYLRGGSLTETLDEIGGPMDLPTAMVLFEDMASALNTAHRAGVVHRDVQPENVMVGPDGRATLFDFGIAYAADDHVHTAAGTIMGTLVYSAPEQRRGDPVDQRTDIFGVGAILYEMLTGRKAIQARTFEEALEATTANLPAPSRRNRDVPAELDAICLRMLADDPATRYQDLRSMLVELGKLRLEGSEAVKQAVFGSVEQRAVDAVQLAFREGDLKKAAQLGAELEAACPPGHEGEVHHLNALVHVAQGRPDLAERCFEKAVFHDPDTLEITVDYAMHLMRAQDYERVQRLLDGVPGAWRGNLMVLGLLDVVTQLPDAPPEVWQDPGGQDQRPGLLGSLRSLFRKDG